MVVFAAFGPINSEVGLISHFDASWLGQARARSHKLLRSHVPSALENVGNGLAQRHYLAGKFPGASDVFPFLPKASS